MTSEMISTRKMSEAIGGVQSETLLAHRVRERELDEGLVSPGPAESSKAVQSRDFPYFEFYPYGYVY